MVSRKHEEPAESTGIMKRSFCASNPAKICEVDLDLQLLFGPPIIMKLETSDVIMSDGRYTGSMWAGSHS